MLGASAGALHDIGMSLGQKLPLSNLSFSPSPLSHFTHHHIQLTSHTSELTTYNITFKMGSYADSTHPWWKTATFYQVYPASFLDSNGDGWGDLPGLITKIPYLSQLGIDCLWVSPIFSSPQKDMGYDVSDYQNIHPPYGTVEDVDTLIAVCHDHGMKIILDLVVNHTSDQHPWFKESRSSKTNPKRDWYIWRPARYDDEGKRHPPTNWRGYFAGSTWAWDEETQEYYLHLYAEEQPDLNWENEECRQAIYEQTMRFWLRRGVDGFRIDTVNKYSKVIPFRDVEVSDPGAEWQPAPEMWCNGPRIHEYIGEINTVLAEYGAVSVGELSNTPDPKQVLPYIEASEKQLDMVFEFSVIRLGNGNLFQGKYVYTPFPLSQLKRLTAKWQTFIDGTDGWATVFCENHDNGRAVSRFGDVSTTEMWERSAKTIALWQTTMTGTLFLYQGQEIGMVNMPESWGIEEYKDIEAVNFMQEAIDLGDKERIEKTKKGLSILARDHSRVPFTWRRGENSGFTADEDKAWMRVHDNREINAVDQMRDPGSVWGFYRHMLSLRRELRDLFVFGTHKLLDPEDERVWSYVKEESCGKDGFKRKALVVMNFSREPSHFVDVAATLGCGKEKVRLVIGTTWRGDGRIQIDDDALLGPWEGRVYCNFSV